jgi:hypothetical protein
MVTFTETELKSAVLLKTEEELQEFVNITGIIEIARTRLERIFMINEEYVQYLSEK